MFTCEWSGLQVETRTYVPARRGKNGCFADVNCMLAYLEHKKPRNWRKKVAETERLCGKKDIFRAPREGWSLTDPRRVLPPPAIAATAAAKKVNKQQNNVYGVYIQSNHFVLKKSAEPPKKKRKLEEPVVKEEPAYVPSNFAEPKRARFKVQITDDYDKRKVFFTDDWRHDVQQEGYDLSHGIPAYFDETGSYVLHPLLACDGKTLSATPCRIRVTFLQ